MYSPAFLHATDGWLLEREGEWGKVPGDRGGRTRWGISSKAFPKVDLDTLTWAGAQALYHTVFWEPLRADDLPEALALALFDWSVPSGVPRAAIALQEVLGVRMDGEIGPQTLAAVRASALSRVLERLLSARVAFHLRDWKAHPEQPIQGWLNRVVALALEVGSEASGASGSSAHRGSL